MPRQSRGPSASAPKRPQAPPTRAAAPLPQQPSQARQASTVARPAPGTAANASPAQAASGGQSMFGTMASTAAGAVVGTSIGHAIGGFFGGGSSHSQEAAPVADASSPLAQTEQGQYAMNQTYDAPKACGFEVNSFRKCMDDNRGDLTICGWYLDQLKACQSTASQY
ncbi:hypothetical protein LTR78_005850 [Recurvomyces mirabilis]|uniref:Uncharacterized protein n=1 Tax=Recurvomyces mirabilis TaxID=574656 RepID=A0AAE1C163_9PEZI|nr:hypothetical protein LTR78_005850 [Recurvomyces mirabilis]KAK5154231.1 hypothetical protein LTS14_006916 [Recurvomyces mirabilis]